MDAKTLGIICGIIAIIYIAAVFYVNIYAFTGETRHFKSEEFACPCCGQDFVEPELTMRLEILRHLIGDKPIYINSGYRCREHNAWVRGSVRSQHTKGRAADIRAQDITPRKLAALADEAGFSFVVAHDTYVHVDVR